MRRTEVFLLSVLLIASVVLAAGYEYGNSISCSGSSCQAITFELAAGESKTFTLNDNSYTLKYVSYEKLPYDYEYYKASVEVNGKRYETNNWNIEEIFGLSSMGGYVDVTTKKFSVSITEDALCKGESKYSACFSKYEVPVSKGWNLISVLALAGDKELSTCPTNTDEIKDFIFIYDAEKKNYVRGSETNNIESKMSTRSVHLYTAGVTVWYYSPKSCKSVIQNSKTSSSNFDNYFANAMSTLKQNNVNFVAGWNFLQITPDMTGKKLSDIKGDCEIIKAYGFDHTKQQWESVKDTSFASSAIGQGIAFKTTNECRLGEVIAPPPPLPA